jgi:Meiotically up-regulated gene 113
LDLLPESVSTAAENDDAEQESGELPPRPGVAGQVYLARMGQYYKVGMSRAVGRRIAELERHQPEPLTLVHALQTDDPEGIERYWLDRFEKEGKKVTKKGKLLNGEWFSLSHDDVAALKRRGRLCDRTGAGDNVFAMSNAARFEEALGSQIGFLERSTQLYDSGQEDESLRLATTMRVIFHQTASSTSLLTHLRLARTKMLSSARGHGDWKDYLGHKIDLTSPQPITMTPPLGQAFTEISLAAWWNGEPIFIDNGTAYTRKKIILSLANKDGGAHVDETLEAYYEVLRAGRYAFGFRGNIGNMTYNSPPPFPQGVTIYPNNAHFALARQFAHETLASQRHFKWPAVR